MHSLAQRCFFLFFLVIASDSQFALSTAKHRNKVQMSVLWVQFEPFGAIKTESKFLNPALMQVLYASPAESLPILSVAADGEKVKWVRRWLEASLTFSCGWL